MILTETEDPVKEIITTRIIEAMKDQDMEAMTGINKEDMKDK